MTNWTPNEKQKLFMGVLKDNPEGLTLFQVCNILNKDKKEEEKIKIATGTVNALLTKGLVTNEKKDFKCKLIEEKTGMVLGVETKSYAVYSLVQTQTNNE